MTQFDFAARHIGPRETEVLQMLKTLRLGNLSEFMSKVTPSHLRNVEGTLQLEAPLSEG